LASITGIISIISLIISKWLEYKLKIIEEHRKKKIPVYEELVEYFIKNIVLSERLGQEGLNEQEVMEFLAGITPKLIGWGSNDVISAYNEFRALGLEDKNEEKAIQVLDNLLVEIRKDLGHSVYNLPKHHLLRLFTNDVDEFMSKTKG